MLTRKLAAYLFNEFYINKSKELLDDSSQMSSPDFYEVFLPNYYQFCDVTKITVSPHFIITEYISQDNLLNKHIYEMFTSIKVNEYL